MHVPLEAQGQRLELTHERENPGFQGAFGDIPERSDRTEGPPHLGISPVQGEAQTRRRKSEARPAEPAPPDQPSAWERGAPAETRRYSRPGSAWQSWSCTSRAWPQDVAVKTPTQSPLARSPTAELNFQMRRRCQVFKMCLLREESP